MATFSLKCEEHRKILDSYCKRHDASLCLSCALSHHKSCEDIIPLVDAAKNANKSTAFTDLQETISVGLKNIQTIVQNINPEYLVGEEKKIKEAIKEERAKIDQQLDEMEQNLLLELNSILTSCKSKQNEVLKSLKESEKTIKHLKDQTTELKNFASDLHTFIKTREINEEVHECFKSALRENVIEKYNFNVEIDPVLKSIPTDIKAFGKIKVEVMKENVQLSQPRITQAQIHLHPVTKNLLEIEVNLKQAFTIKKESGTMWITGCAILTNGHVLIADYKGKEQLMQYNQNGTHVRDIPVSSKPYDITVIDPNRVAVSYGVFKYIEILNIQSKTVEKKVDLDNIIWGLSYQGGKLYVVVYRRGVVVINMSGKIVNTININVNSVRYVATTTDKIYFSDYMADTVTCCDMSGKQIWKFKDDNVIKPCGLTVDKNQNVIVLGRSFDNVAIISCDGTKSKIFLTKSDGLFDPLAIDLDEATGDILVCNRFDANAFLFRLSGYNEQNYGNRLTFGFRIF